MKTTFKVLTAVVVLGSLPLTVFAQPKGERITVSGDVVDMWCYLDGGDRGAAKKPCATACAKAGNAMAFSTLQEICMSPRA